MLRLIVELCPNSQGKKKFKEELFFTFILGVGVHIQDFGVPPKITPAPLAVGVHLDATCQGSPRKWGFLVSASLVMSS